MFGRGSATRTFVASTAAAPSSRPDIPTIMEIMVTDMAAAAISTVGPWQPAVRNGGIVIAPASTELCVHTARPRFQAGPFLFEY